MCCSFLSASAALMQLPMISRVMTATVRPSCRWLFSPGWGSRLPFGRTREKAAMPVKCRVKMPAPSTRLPPHLSN
ncbi:hypothetical protein D3C80_2118110 [compost metagenome]